MVGPRTSTTVPHVKDPQKARGRQPHEWFKLPLRPVTNTILNPTSIERVEYHLHFGKEARGWRNMHTFAHGRPSLPNLRELRVVIDGSALDKLNMAQCRDFRLAAELIGPINFRVERLEVVYLPHRRTEVAEHPGEPDSGTFARDEVQESVVRNIAKVLEFGQGRVTLEVENEMWPGRGVSERREEPMKMVYTRGRWD